MPIEAVRIKGLVESSLIEWPGKLASVIFLPGCNLRCRYCHSRDIIIGGASAIESIPVGGVLEMVADMKGWIDGVVLSGGEPTICPDIEDFCRHIKSRGLAVKLDTNGTRPRVIQALIRKGLIDAVAMDVKAPLDYRYLEITQTIFGVRKIAASIEIVMNSSLPYEFRTTVAPGLLSAADIGLIAQAIEGARRYVLQPFNPHVCLDRDMEQLPPCPPSVLQDCARVAQGFVEEVVVKL